MSQLRIEKKEGTYFLHGSLTETSDLSPLQMAYKNEQTIKLNMKNMTHCNSIGIQLLLRTIESWGDQTFEYHECHHDFANQVDMLPALLGRNRQGTFASMIVSYECTQCNHIEQKFTNHAELLNWSRQGGSPTITCPCGREASMEAEDDTQFHFLELE